MEDKLFVHVRQDGGVSVTAPAWSSKRSSETDAEFLARAKTRAVEVGTIPNDAIEISRSDLPGTRLFRNAWQLASGTISVNMIEARVLHMELIRKQRNLALELLDKEQVIALGKADASERDRIEAVKQVLRDIPQTFDISAPNTPDKLDELWPVQVPRSRPARF